MKKSDPVKTQIGGYRTAYGPKTRFVKTFPEPSIAKQSFQEECNINNIMKRYEKTGLIAHVNEYKGDYGAFEAVQDYHSAYNTIIAANRSFESLPSTIRNRFENSPGNFLKFVNDETNHEEMKKLGLLPREAAPAPPQRVEIVETPSPIKTEAATPEPQKTPSKHKTAHKSDG